MSTTADITSPSPATESPAKTHSACGELCSTNNLPERNDAAAYARSSPNFPEDQHQLLKRILTHTPSYKALCKLQDESLQTGLNLLQKVMDNPAIDCDLRTRTLRAMRRLCEKSGAFPQQLRLQKVEIKGRPDGYPDSYGGFGDVFKGTFNNILVAVKVPRHLRETNSREVVNASAFAREAILCSQLFHPNVLPYYGVADYLNSAEKNKSLALVSPWQENGDILDYLIKFPDVPRLPLVLDVVQGLQYLHEHKIVHGDLKAKNVLVGDDGRACLADFGLSCISREAPSVSRTLQTTCPSAGTPGSQAPELLKGESESPSLSSDIYSLASVMYEIFTNERPFHKRSPAQVILKVAGGEIPTRPLSGPKSELCDRIWGLMVRCWSPNPKSRPTVGDVKVELMVVESTPPLQEGVQPRNAFQGPSAQNVRTRSRVTAFTKDELELLSRCNVKNNAPKHTYPLRFALAIRNHIAMSTSEITVAKGDELELIIYETKRWWLARKRQSGQIGLVPLDVFSPLGFPWGDLDHTREPEDSCDPFLDEAMVFQNHEADTDRYPDEISVKKGDKLRIAHCIGPSWLARKEDGSVGLVRFRHVYPDPSTTGPKFAAGKPTFKVRAKQEYDGDCEDPRIIPRFSEGEMMDVIDRSTDRWWLVRDKEGSLGWVQPKYLDDLSSGNIN